MKSPKKQRTTNKRVISTTTLDTSAIRYTLKICKKEGVVNRHNCRYWSDSNPQIFRKVHIHHREKLSVCGQVFSGIILDYPRNSNGELDLLQTTVNLALAFSTKLHHDAHKAFSEGWIGKGKKMKKPS